MVNRECSLKKDLWILIDNMEFLKQGEMAATFLILRIFTVA